MRLNKTATFTALSDPKYDANGKKLPQTSSTITKDVHFERNLAVSDERLGTQITSVNDVFNLHSDCDIDINAGDTVTVDEKEYSIKKVTRARRDGFFILRCVCEKI